MDIAIRKRNLPIIEIKAFESATVFLLLIYFLVLTHNFTVLAVVGTTFLSLAWAFRELLSNLSSTLVMYAYPQYEINDVLSVKGEDGLQYENLGFLRTKMRKANGDLVYVPNRMLLNDMVTVK